MMAAAVVDVHTAQVDGWNTTSSSGQKKGLHHKRTHVP